MIAQNPGLWFFPKASLIPSRFVRARCKVASPAFGIADGTIGNATTE
jgi:hypothetical protein